MPSAVGLAEGCKNLAPAGPAVALGFRSYPETTLEASRANIAPLRFTHHLLVSPYKSENLPRGRVGSHSASSSERPHGCGIHHTNVHNPHTYAVTTTWEKGRIYAPDELQAGLGSAHKTCFQPPPSPFPFTPFITPGLAPGESLSRSGGWPATCDHALAVT